MAISSWKSLGYKNTIEIYRETHERMKNKYSNKTNLTIEKENAKLLETFLFNIKNADKGISSPIEGLANINYLDIVKKATAAMPNARSIHSIFRRAHNRSQKLADGADDIFEQELSAVFEATKETSLLDKQNVVIDTKNLLAGRQAANICHEITKNTLTIAQRTIISNINKANKTNNSLYEKPVARPAKVDIQGAYAEIDIETQVASNFQQLANLLKDATISAKNYSSQYWSETEGKKIDKNIISLHLGSSDIFKAFVGGMSSLGYSPDIVQKAFFAGYNSYKNKNNKEIGYHIYHLRFLYELTGAGLYDNEGNNLKEVKYLIWNDPATDNVKVFSTAVLIDSLLQGDIASGENPFGGIYLRYQQ